MTNKKTTLYTRIITLSSILLLGCIVVCCLRWKAWFGNPPEHPYTIPAYPNRIVLTMAPSHEYNWRRIAWRCDTIPSTAHLELIHTNTNDTSFLKATNRIVKTRRGTEAHFEVIFPVQRGEYIYRVHNDSIHSTYHSFYVQEDACSKILVLGDLQDESPLPIAQLLEDIYNLHPDLDMCAFTGDLIERPTDHYWNVWHASVAPIVGKLPIVACPGNHEHIKGWKRQLDERWVATFGETDIEHANNGNAIYSGTNFQLAALNSDVSFRFWLMKQQRYALQQNWDTPSHQWRIMLSHHPFFTIGAGRHASLTRGIWKDFVHEHGVHLLLNGHDHVFARMVSRHNNTLSTPVYMVCNSSQKQYTPKQQTRFERIAANQRFYTLLSITSDSLWVHTYTADNHTLYDALLCQRTPQGVVVTELVEY